MNILETEEELSKYSSKNYKDNIEIFSFKNQVHIAKIVDCYDGDTITCVFKHNGSYFKFKIRMLGYDSPEMKPSKKIPEEEREKIKELAIVAKKRLEELILNKNVYIFCDDFEKYGRILGTIKITLDDEKSVNDIMLEEGHGYSYNGGTKKKSLFKKK